MFLILHDVKIKHQVNICQVILNSKLIDSKFAAFFLNSKLGYEYIKLRATGSTIVRISKSNIRKLKIPDN